MYILINVIKQIYYKKLQWTVYFWTNKPFYYITNYVDQIRLIIIIKKYNNIMIIVSIKNYFLCILIIFIIMKYTIIKNIY